MFFSFYKLCGNNWHRLNIIKEKDICQKNTFQLWFYLVLVNRSFTITFVNIFKLLLFGWNTCWNIIKVKSSGFLQHHLLLLQCYLWTLERNLDTDLDCQEASEEAQLRSNSELSAFKMKTLREFICSINCPKSLWQKYPR